LISLALSLCVIVQCNSIQFNSENYRERIVSGKVGDATPEEITQSVEMVLQSKTRGPKRRQDRISHNRISFGDLARTIADKWKILDPKSRSIYSHYAGKEKNRYRKEVLIWKQKKESEHDAELMARHANLLNSSTNTSSLHSSIGSDTTTSSSPSNSLFDPSNSISSQSQLQLQFQLQQQQQQGCRDQDQNQIHPVATTLESSMKQDGVIRRQQDILREQMGFKDNNNSSQSWSNSSSFATVGGVGSGGNTNTIYPYPCVSPCGSSSMITPNDIMAVALQRRQLQQQQQQQSHPADKFQQQAISRHQRMQLEQYEQLEDITLQLQRLKQEQERMQQQILDHPDMQTTGSSIAMNSTSTTNNNVALDRSSHMNDLNGGYSNNNNSQPFSVESLRSNFDFEERRRMESGGGGGVSSGSSSSNIFPKGHSSCPGSFHAARGVAGQRQNSRHNFLFSTGDNVQSVVTGNNNSNVNGHSSCPISVLASAATSFSRRNSLFDNVNGEPVDDDISPMMFSLDPK
jgi:hypothetical protein